MKYDVREPELDVSAGGPEGDLPAAASFHLAPEPVPPAPGEAEPRPRPQGGLFWALQVQLGSAPWWVVSAIVHIVLVFITMLFVVSVQEQESEETLYLDTIEKEPPPVIPRRMSSLVARQIEVDLPEIVEHPVFAHEEVEEVDHMETENLSEEATAKGQEDAISDVPLGDKGISAAIGVGVGSPAAGVFGNRGKGGRKKAALTRGGTIASESAVEAGLGWLARHQEPDGHWDSTKFGGGRHVGLTGLSLLAFLGAGHTENVGRYQDNVRRAVNYLVSIQQENGMIQDLDRKGDKTRPRRSKDLGYNHPICGLALAEAYGMSKNSRTGQAAQKAINYSVDIHQKKGKEEYTLEAWRYTANSAADTSVVGWFIMQLKSARVAGLNVPEPSFAGARRWIDHVTIMPGDKKATKRGGAASDPDTPSYENTNIGRAGYQDKSASRVSTTAIAMASRAFLGEKRSSPLLSGAAQHILENPAKWTKGKSNESFYYWYYATMGMFQLGGTWFKQWNVQCRETLVKSQIMTGNPTTDDDDTHGSWDPVGRHLASGGRVMSTSLAVLTLEVYYRYLPIYK